MPRRDLPAGVLDDRRLLRGLSGDGCGAVRAGPTAGLHGAVSVAAMKKPPRQKVEPVARIRPSFLRDALCDQLSVAIRFGLRRAFKHRDDSLTEEQEEAICDSVLQEVENAIHDVLDFGENTQGGVG